MVTILPGFSKELGGGAQEVGDSSPRFFAPSFLTPPQYGVPNRVLLRGVNLGVENLGDKVECYKELSKWSSKQLGFKLSVDIHSDDNGNSLVIDTHDVSHLWAIGPRLELLEKYYGIGKWLLGLIRRCPLDIWTPEYVSDMGDCLDVDFRQMYPDWAMNTTNPHRMGDLPDMPPNLRKIVTECMAVDCGMFSRQLDYDDMTMYPFGMCTWYGNTPNYNRRSKKLNPYVEQWQERGTNMLWILADHLADISLQSSWVMCPIAPFHSEEDYKDCIKATKPFMKLMKYLTHDHLEEGFSLCF